MTATATPARPTLPTRLRVGAAHGSPVLLSLVALVVILALAVANQPGILTIPGLTLMLMSAIPLVFAAQAQMLIMSVGDIDLGVGYLVGLVTVIAATALAQDPLLGIAMLLGIVAVYAVLGLVVERRGVPSIIVTLGMSFVWLGLGLQLLPTPGGAAPEWLATIGSWRPTWIPAPLVFIAIATARPCRGWSGSSRARASAVPSGCAWRGTSRWRSRSR